MNHLRKVLKADVGATVKMGMLNGMLFVAHVIEAGEKAFRFRLEAVEGSEWTDEAAGVCLLLGTPRPNMIKSICVVGATMGVDQMLFVRSERVDKSYFQSKMLEDAAVKKNLIHGAEQGVIRRLPKVATFPNPNLEAFLRDIFPAWEQRFKEEHPEATLVKLIAEPRVEDNLMAALSRESNFAKSTYVVLAIGPEGGWVPPEVEMLRNEGFAVFHCGDRILRTETAVIALLAQLMLAKDALVNEQLAQTGDVKRAKN